MYAYNFHAGFFHMYAKNFQVGFVHMYAQNFLEAAQNAFVYAQIWKMVHFTTVQVFKISAYFKVEVV